MLVIDGEVVTKLAIVIALLHQNRDTEALAIVAKFPRLGDEKKVIMRGYECMVRPEFYRQLGFVPEHHVNAAIAAIRLKYKAAYDARYYS